MRRDLLPGGASKIVWVVLDAKLTQSASGRSPDAIIPLPNLGLSPNGAVLGGQSQRQVQQGPFLWANGSQGRETQHEGLVFFDLRDFDLSVSVKDLEPELPGPARAAEKLADHTVFPFSVRTTVVGICRVTRAASQPAYQDFEPPAERAKQTRRNRASTVPICIPCPDRTLGFQHPLSRTQWGHCFASGGD